MKSKILSFFVFISTAIILAHPAQAIVINASGGSGPETITNVDPDMPGIPPGWTIGGPQNPIDVALDPNAGPWLKNLLNADTTKTANNVFSLDEFIRISGDRTITNWEEKILTDGWEWAVPPLATFSDGSRLPGFTATINGTFAQMKFDPLPPGTEIWIFKQLEWKGSGEFFGTVQVKEYPTPEPSTLALFVLGYMGFLLNRRRL